MIDFDEVDKPKSENTKPHELFYRKGELVGKEGIKFWRKVKSNKNDNVALFICHCGEMFKSRTGYVKNGSVKSCGCQIYKIRNRND